MKRKQKLFSLLLILALALALAGCGSAKSSGSYAAEPVAPAAAYDTGSYYDSYYPAEESMEMAGVNQAASPSAAGGLGSNSRVDPDARPMSEKVIYNGNVRLETTEFDAAVERINELIAECEGYLESSSVSGSNYRSISKGETGARSASYTIRVPSVNFSRMMGTLPEIGNVPYSEISSRNVTREYYDVQARLDAFKTQEARLLEMLSVAETVKDMLEIQQQLTEVQYEIDSLTGTLRYYDDQVSYSTVYLSVQEVREYTPEPTITLSYKERMVKGFRESLAATANFFKEFALWFVTSLPWLIPLVLAFALVIALLRRLFTGSGERKARRQAKREAKKARKEAKAAEMARRRQEKKLRGKNPETAPEANSVSAPEDAPAPAEEAPETDKPAENKGEEEPKNP